ncbi:hypothetical protein IT575_01190 [bacterium]|nr:hypothetical protein [bacterium]
MTITDIIEQLSAWIAAQDFTPAVREQGTIALLPAASYPQLVITPLREDFGAGRSGAAFGDWPGGSEAKASLSLRIACAAGRPEQALRDSAALARQIRAALLQSGSNLGGSVKSIAVGGISYAQAPQAGAGAVVSTAELEVEVLYVC